MSWDNADYLGRALRIWLRAFRTLVRTRLEAEFGEDWYPSEVEKALGNHLWPDLKKNIDKTPSRTVEESFDPSHIRQILIAKGTRDLFADLFPHRDLLEARLQYVAVVRNTEVAHPRDTELTLEELDEYVGPMIVLLSQAGSSSAVAEIEELQRQAKLSRKSPDASAEAAEVSGRSGAGQDDSEPLLRRRPDIFEVTRPSRARREGRPYVRLAADRTVPKEELPDWTPVLLGVVDRAREPRGRLASRVLPKVKNLIPGFDFREYGHSTFPDLVATRSDLFRLTHRGRGKAFITRRS